MGRALWGEAPRESITRASARYGSHVVVAACVDLLHDRPVTADLVRVLGGPRADLTADRPATAYWLRVWALRGLLWNWDEVAGPEVCDALADPQWRVREMAARVVARHAIGDALPGIAALRMDPHPRVRAVAVRALARLTAADQSTER